MSLSENKLLKGILCNPTIIICGEEEKLSIYSMQQLLLLQMEKPLVHLYFIKPTEDVIELLEEKTTKLNYTIVQNVEQINDLKMFNIIVCGIGIDSKEFIKKIKCIKKQIVIFFRQLGHFRTLWENIGTNILIREQGLNDFISEVVPPEPHFSEPLHNSQWNEREFFFTNRGKALDLYRDFKANLNIRCCVIVGVRGIGKRTFINKLKISGLTNYVDHYCIHKNDDLTYFLKCLLGRFNVQYRDSEIPNDLDPDKVDPLVKKLFSAFDIQKKCNLIFYDIDIIYDKKKGCFYDPNLAIFFKHLLQRPSYQGNKVYITSEFDFKFTSVPTNRFQVIYLNTLTAEYIKYILEHEFSKPTRDSSAYATDIMQYEDKIIDRLIGGYPPIAHIFVNTCIEYSMEEIVNSGFAYSIFQKKKYDELREFIKLEEYEIAILSYLSLFRKPFNVEGAQVFQSDASIVLEHLKHRMLLEKVMYEKHTNFYVPSFIQDYIISISEEETIKANHNKIGDYYWETAENKKQNYYEQLEDYRHALYHYEAANNTEKQYLLMTQFTGIFLNTAYEFYTANKLNEAYSAYDFLYKNGALTNTKHLNLFLICNARLNKKKALEVFEIIARKYSTDIHIQNSYANYLYSIGHFSTAEEVCLGVMNIDKNDCAVTNIYVKILNKKGEKTRACLILERLINKLQSTRNRSRYETKNLITALMTYFSFIDYFTAFQTAVQNIGLYLRLDGMPNERIKDLFIKPIPLDAELRIIALFEKARNHKKRNINLLSIYAAFLKRQGKYIEANELKIQMNKLDYHYKTDYGETFPLSPDLEKSMEAGNQHPSIKLHKGDLEKSMEAGNQLPTIKLHKGDLEKSMEAGNQHPTIKLHKGDLEKSIETKSQFPIRKLHKTEIQNELHSFRKIMEDALAKLDAIFAIESDNYPSLVAQSNCFLDIEYLRIFEDASNAYYRELLEEENKIIETKNERSKKESTGLDNLNVIDAKKDFKEVYSKIEADNKKLQKNNLRDMIFGFLREYYSPSKDENYQQNDEDYQISFSGEHKAYEIEKYLNSLSQLDYDKLVYVSIGGADGSEIECVMKKKNIHNGILIEYSDYGAEKARERSERLLAQGFNLRILQGDAMQRINDCQSLLIEWVNKYDISGVILSFQSVLHELSNRSPNYDPNVLFAKIFSPFTVRIFHSREPTFAQNWPKIIHLKINNVPGSVLINIANQINNVLHFHSQVDELADGFIQINSNLATELLFKILYCKDIIRYKYEMEEKLTSIDPTFYSNILRNYINPKINVEKYFHSTETFKKCYKNYEVSAKSIEGQELDLPNTFLTLTGYQI